jgi:hypothetical protein
MTSPKKRMEFEEAADQIHGSESPALGRGNVPPPNDLLEGRGRLIPALATGIEYPVEFGINSPPVPQRHGRASKPTRWAKCRIRPAQKRVFPDGVYFLRTEEGAVHQLKVIGGVWHCLALAF